MRISKMASRLSTHTQKSLQSVIQQNVILQKQHLGSQLNR